MTRIVTPDGTVRYMTSDGRIISESQYLEWLKEREMMAD